MLPAGQQWAVLSPSCNSVLATTAVPPQHAAGLRTWRGLGLGRALLGGKAAAHLLVVPKLRLRLAGRRGRLQRGGAGAGERRDDGKLWGVRVRRGGAVAPRPRDDQLRRGLHLLLLLRRRLAQVMVDDDHLLKPATSVRHRQTIN